MKNRIIREENKLNILIEKELDLSNVFGTLKTKTYGQKFKNI
ncbi:MAG TPA: hypothetical protein VJG30_02250 [Candidatus Nanoarchaeia archaeon]|nr:hypothetical protein [Candidatus Nanoarchaeia archaeon]